MAGIGIIPSLAQAASWSGHGRLPQVRFATSLGVIDAEIDIRRAPRTAANFLAYVQRGLLESGQFYRTVHAGNDHNPAGIRVIQGGLNLPDEAPSPLPPVEHETTAQTGLRHLNGTLSMARNGPGTATSEFFICLGANPVLDFGGARNPDGQGFSAFGRVIRGMSVVRRIHTSKTRLLSDDAYTAGQMLDPVVGFRAQQIRR